MKRIHFFFAKIILTSLFAGIPVILTGQSNKDSSMPQYLFTEFSNCKVRMENGQIQTTMMNYNTVSERMVYIKNDTPYDLINPEMVDTVFLQNSKFVPEGKGFYEVLLSGPIDLLIQHKGSLVSAANPSGYGGTSETASSEYISSVNLSSGYYNLPIPSDFIVKISPVYWIRKDQGMFSFLNEKQFLKIFPGKEGELKQFIDQNRIKFDKLSNLVRLVEHCNELNH